jgi:putative chitinase
VRKITDSELQKVMPNCKSSAQWTEALNKAMDKFDISNKHRVAAFLAQIAHESGELRTLVENLNYSAKRLTQVWPKKFPTLEAAAPYANNPKKLANRVYSNRLGNGAPNSDDGWRYRGRGIMQITGRANYHDIGIAIGMDLELQPEQLELPLPAALAAAQFWKSRGLNVLADDLSNDDQEEDFKKITIRINGGTTGLKARKAYWITAKQVIT